jgi:BirA family biotin operon repressor/biotin-[acetyl-CoA-carboxylase] ligase
MIGHRILHYETLPSTFDVAWEHANNQTNHGLIVRAEEQTRGKGQRGAVWHAPPNSSLLLSILLFPPNYVQLPVLLTLWGALAICETLATSLCLTPQLKWPNDILLQGKKVCGVLVERRHHACVVGLGLNVQVPAEQFVQAGLHHAASLQDFTTLVPEKESLLQNLIAFLNSSYANLEQRQFEPLLHAWKNFSGLEGAWVELTASESLHRGWIRSLSLDAIFLETPSGTLSFSPESIQQIRPLSAGPEITTPLKAAPVPNRAR